MKLYKIADDDPRSGSTRPKFEAVSDYEALKLLLIEPEPCPGKCDQGQVTVDSATLVGVPGGLMPDRCPDCSGGMDLSPIGGRRWTELAQLCDDLVELGKFIEDVRRKDEALAN